MTRVSWLIPVASLLLCVASGQVSESLKRHEKSDIATLARITRADHSTIFFGGLTDAGYIRDGVVYSVVLEHGPRRSDFRFCMEQAVSRDGSRIAYTTAADGPTGCRIVIRDLRTATERDISITQTQPSLWWSANDTEIVYQDGNAIVAVSVAYGNKSLLTSWPWRTDSKVPEDGCCAAISAVDGRIAYILDGKVSIVDADGSNRRSITSVPPALPFLPFLPLKEYSWTQIVWSPNGERLWFGTLVDEGGQTNLYLVDVKSGRRRKILKHSSITITDWRKSFPIPNR